MGGACFDPFGSAGAGGVDGGSAGGGGFDVMAPGLISLTPGLLSSAFGQTVDGMYQRLF